MTAISADSKPAASWFKPLATALGFVGAVLIYWFSRSQWGLENAAAMTAAVTTLCAVWWSTEAIPIPATSLVPFAVFPLMGVLDHNELAEAWGDKFILLFAGGFMISRAAEKADAHLRVARGVIKLVGTASNRRVVIGFMLATAFCSMWISNTATALIMLPVAVAVIQQNPGRPRFAISLLLAIAYGSSIGGMATVIGTPPNGVMISNYEKVLPGSSIDFLTWMKIGVPVTVLMLLGCAAVLTLRVSGPGQKMRDDLGPWTAGQVRVLLVIGATAALWITRNLPFGWGGWSEWLDMPKAHDATIAMLAVVVMFLIPNGRRNDDGSRDHLLDWKTAREIPWGILLLFAGGLAIAKAFGTTGLADAIGGALNHYTEGLHPFMVIAVICLIVTFFTEVTSNTASTTLLMPILAGAAIGRGLDPAVLMIPAALSASCAFMLPVATPPNAIVFGGSDLITIPRMARTGLVLNLIGAVIVSVCCYFILDPQTGLGGPDAPPPAAGQAGK